MGEVICITECPGSVRLFGLLPALVALDEVARSSDHLQGTAEAMDQIDPQALQAFGIQNLVSQKVALASMAAGNTAEARISTGAIHEILGAPECTEAERLASKSGCPKWDAILPHVEHIKTIFDV